MLVGSYYPVKPMAKLTAAALVIAAAGRFAAGDGSPDHGSRTTDTAVDRDGAGDAVELTGATFHAVLRTNELCPAFSHHKDAVRADHLAQPTADAALRAVSQRVERVGEHHPCRGLCGCAAVS